MKRPSPGFGASPVSGMMALMAIPEHISHRLLQLLPKDPAMLVLDFDGVFTDDRVYVREDGMETVACTRKDGLGIALLRRLGFPVIVLSTEKNPIVTARCRAALAASYRPSSTSVLPR